METPKARGVGHPVTALWFSEPRASGAAIFFALCGCLGLWLAWRFHIDPDQVTLGRTAWMGIEHGMAGFLFGAGLAGFAFWLAAQSLARLATRAPALAITESGIRMSALVVRPIGGAIRLTYDQIDRVQMERRESGRRFPFNLGRNPPVLDLTIYRRSAKPIRIWSGALRGEHREAYCFAETLRRAIALHHEGAR